MTPPPPALPLAKAAFDHPPTALGHRYLVLKRLAWLTLVLSMTAATIYMGAEHPPSDTIGLIVFGLLTFPLLLWVTFMALRRTKRVAAILRTYPWRAYPCEYPSRTGERPKVIRIKFAENYAPILRFTPFSVCLAEKLNPQPDTIWFAGDPRYGGVVSPVGGHFPVRVVPEAMGEAVPGGTPEDDALAVLAGLVKSGRVHTT